MLIHLGRKRMVVTLIIGSLLIPSQPFITKVAGVNPEPCFSISILAPHSYFTSQWSSLIVEQLPKIGIGIDVYDHTGWAQISPRTWGYPGPYPVPSYDEGGFDILIVGWSWGLDWDPTGLFDSPSITPNGDNFYQYSSEAMDSAISSYTSSFNLTDRLEYIGKIQTILYEDLPQVTVLYRMSCYPHVSNLANFNPILWTYSYYPFHEMNIENQTTFHYATPADFEDFHIHTYESHYDAQWLYQIYNGLLERDSLLHNGFSPWLAESVSSTDGLTYHVKIKDEAVWADGTALTTDDVIYNYQLAVTPALGGFNYQTNILYWDNDSITKINDKEFSIEFLQSYVFQDGNLALDLIPEHIWGAIDPADHQATAVTWAKDNPENMFGAGPYMLEEYNPTNGFIHLVANPHFVDWYGTNPNFNNVSLQFYSSKEGALAALAGGTVDMVDAQFSPQLNELDLPNVNYTLCDDPGTQDIGFNMMHPILGTGILCPIAGAESAKHVRKAISHIMPRQTIVDEIFGGLGKPGVTACPPVAVGFNQSLVPYEYDIEKAIYHMEQAGFEMINTNTGVSLVLSLSFYYIVVIYGLLGAGLWIIRKNTQLNLKK